MSLYEVLKASKTERFPDYWTLLWGRKMSASMIKTITGVLPLTFTAKGGTAADWVIEGNDENGTENEFNGTYIHAVPSGSGSSATLVYVSNTRTGTIPCSANTQYAIKVFDNTSRFMVCCSENAPAENISLDMLYRAVGDEREIIVTTNATANYLYVYVGNENEEPPMVIEKGSTVPDHYIPYQLGVGERTVNLFNESNFALVKVTSTAYRYGTIIGKLPQGTYTLTATKSVSAQYIYLTKVSNGTYTFEEVTNVPYTFTADGLSQYILRIADQAEYDSWAQFGYSEIMLVEGSTAPQTYIPYGYQIPIAVSQQGQPDKTVDIYIGDDPLTEGETVSKTSTGVDIELFEGENTVSTTLYNKPTMEIKYK